MIRGILYLSNWFNVHSKAQEATNFFIDIYSDILSEKEKLVIRGLTDKALINQNSANMSEEYFEIRISIVNKIHKEATKMFYC